MSVYKIKGIAQSTCTLTVTAAFEEIGVKYEIDTVDFATGEHKSPAYLEKYQPFGQIPALIDGDFQLFESRAILRYVAAKHGADSLYPTDLQKRAVVEQWLSVNQSNNGPVTDIVSEFVFKVMRGGTPDESRIPELTTKLNTYLAILDKQLSSHTYIAGEDFTLADVSFLAYFHYLLRVPAFANAFDNFANLKRWWQSVSSRPSWKKVTGA